MIPKPFSRVSITYTEPTLVTAASARDAEAEAPRFEALIDDVIAKAERG
jgi:lysophospholipid acyltransferase (LPLAT)-like uncharacterized protein